MRLKRRESLDKIEQDRQRVINYKKFFGTAEGRDVLFDLMNRFSHGINPNPGKSELEIIRAAGNNDVIVYILSQSHTDLAQFDKLLKGEMNVG
jgi:hypothetical protein